MFRVGGPNIQNPRQKPPAFGQGDPQQIQKNQLEQIKKTQYDKIMKHEMAHKSAGGSLAGAINIIYDSNGIAVAGNVPIQMPALDPANPEQTAKDAQTVIHAAHAPGCDCSSQDMAVAAQAASILGKAQVRMAQKKQQEQKTP